MNTKKKKKKQRIAAFFVGQANFIVDKIVEKFLPRIQRAQIKDKEWKKIEIMNHYMATRK